MNVLLVTHGFPPTQHSGVFRTEAFARHLPGFGTYPVAVASSDVQRVLAYPSQSSVPEALRECPVYRNDWRIDIRAGEWPAMNRFLWRLPVGATWIKRGLRRGVLERVLPLARQAVREHQPAVIYASAPPEETILAAVQLNQEYGLPVVADFRDLWSYGFEKRYRHFADFCLERRLEKRCLARCARVVANTPTARDLLVSSLGVDPARVVLLPNGYDETAFAGLPTRTGVEEGRFTVLHTGLLAKPVPPPGRRQRTKRALGIDYNPFDTGNDTRSPSHIVEAVNRLLDRRPGWRQALRVRFIGSFTPEETELLRTSRYPECVTLDAPVSHREALDLCCRADLLLLLQVEMKRRSDGKDSCTAVPAKLFDYLRSGTRILAPIQEGDAAELVRRFNAGVVVPPRDADAIAAALEDEMTRWQRGETRRRATTPLELREYERRALAEKLAETLRAAAEVRS